MALDYKLNLYAFLLKYFEYILLNIRVTIRVTVSVTTPRIAIIANRKTCGFSNPPVAPAIRMTPALFNNAQIQRSNTAPLIAPQILGFRENR